MTSSKLPLIALLAVLIAAIAVFLATSGGGDSAPVAELPTAEDPGEPTADVETGAGGEEPAAVREAVSPSAEITSNEGPALDPELRAEMAGFVGRILHHDGKPAAETEVVLYQFDLSLMLGEIEDILGEETIDPDIDAGEATTDGEGRFEIRGAWPRSVYLLHAGVDSDNPTTVIIERTPANRETVDLGDIYLRDGAVVTGVVVDDDDAPVAGALVRVVDLPAQILQMVPIERFDPEGALIVRERQIAVVVGMPSWVKRRFDQLPLPNARTAADGTFRVTGIPAGNNILAVTKPGHLSAVHAGVTLRAGAEKDVGRVRLGIGEEVYGSVTDAAGEAVPGAQVLVAQGGAVPEVFFAGPMLTAGSDGSFALTGFKPGKVIAAARRHPGDPWVATDPQPVLRDLSIVLPKGFDLTVRLTSKAGRPITAPDLDLLPGRTGDGAVIMKRFGFSQPVDLGPRQQVLEDGRYHFAGLPAGRYSLVARAPGHAMSGAQIKLSSSQEITLQLEPESGLMVQVTEQGGRPVRGAAIYCEVRGPRRQEIGELPIVCGRTSSDGRLVASSIPQGQVRISARHPRYGWVHTETRIPAPEIHLVYREPGAIEGVLTEGGNVPETGKWTIVTERRYTEGRGAMEEMPRLAAPDAKGAFTITGLQPGEYSLNPINSLSGYGSPGSFMQNMFMARMAGMEEVRYVVASGQTTHVALDTEKQPGAVDGPSARVTGSVIVNGRPATGMRVTGWGQGQISAVVDAGGRFDLGEVRVGDLYLQVMDPDSSDIISRGQLWSKSLQIEENENQDLQISLETASLTGRVTSPDGQPAPGTQVRVAGSVGTEGSARANFYSITDEQGTYSLTKIPAGKYSIRAEHDDLGRGFVDPVTIDLGAQRVDVQLRATVAISGRVDRRVFGENVGRLWLTFVSEKGSQNQSWNGIEDDGSFHFDELIPGTYRARIYANYNGQPSKEFVHDSTVQVGPAGLRGLVLRPVEAK